MAVALLLTVAVAYAIGYAMFRSRRVETFMLPLLDVLQSVPILGFFPLALYFFIALLPAAGAELAAIFLIFTSMAWNIIFSVYQSFKTLPRELLDMSRVYLNERLALAHVFIPAALRGVYYNIPISWANAFFFITASEVITLGTEIKLFGIGSLVVKWFDEGDVSSALVGIAVGIAANVVLYLTLWRRLMSQVPQPPDKLAEAAGPWLKYGGYFLAAFAIILLGFVLYTALGSTNAVLAISRLPGSFVEALAAAPFTLVRVLATLAISALVALLTLHAVVRAPRLEAGVLLGVSLISSVPAVFLYPLLGALVRGEALSVTLLLPGAVVYTVLNAVAAWRDVPQDLVKAYQIRGRLYLTQVLIPASMPYLITGLLTAWGGAWNASIVAEPLANVHGLGGLTTQAADRGDISLLVATVATMTLIVVAVNRVVWRRLYEEAAKWR
ncbi:ABC transporter permease subunit [Pyrobaculum sp.]|uniref:ABC transporter permease subunit n=1 Tax=Pyrobaculum sp. TaxID=2004705 RepID=UPI003165ECF7